MPAGSLFAHVLAAVDRPGTTRPVRSEAPPDSRREHPQRSSKSAITRVTAHRRQARVWARFPLSERGPDAWLILFSFSLRIDVGRGGRSSGSGGKCQGLSNLRLGSTWERKLTECDTNIREWLGTKILRFLTWFRTSSCGIARGRRLILLGSRGQRAQRGFGAV